MLLIVDQQNRTREHLVLRSMFEARKRVFIDLLKWDLPALAGRYELDQFDNEDAIYLIVATEEGDHLASARLLLTTRPALLDTLFPGLVEGEVPQGPDVLEITRFCLSPGIGARERRNARDALLVGLAEFALANGVRTYTGVAELPWFRQIQTFGWDCRALGEPVLHRGQALAALRIEIDASTIAKLAAAGIASDAAATDAACAA
ncbi:autoinducer synthase [Sphingopyxis sp. H050]|jgi:N-acyl-L-homoserine lactone synthetase|uniref:acyl-homoserine-lactone synthase n=1 Tax=Sphingopyxis sp. H050 TaxID=1759072 RepID=UPI00073795C3|nr:acyl-homoserine-lactone synthase [Sphingopyxis sp. H050]KTE22833.1 autoinducer synthase [Sphingopyxis sp. H050]